MPVIQQRAQVGSKRIRTSAAVRRASATRGTPWPAWFSGELGLSDTRILEHHVDLNLTDLEAAWAYYHQQPEEIEKVIREDEEA